MSHGAEDQGSEVLPLTLRSEERKVKHMSRILFGLL